MVYTRDLKSLGDYPLTGSTPVSGTINICRGDGTGTHVGLRSRSLGVRLPSPVPIKIAGSFKGRTSGFDPENMGSSPMPASNYKNK